MKTYVKVAGAALLSATIGMPLVVRAQAAREGEVTLIGCIELERDYRARKEGRGAAGGGVGVGNEFVLTSAKPAPGGRRGQPAAATAGPGVDYAITGKLEKDFLRYVGRQVEAIGSVENADAALPSLNVTLWHPVGDYCPAK